MFIAGSPYISPITKFCQCVISTFGSYSEECWSLPAREQVFFAHDVSHHWPQFAFTSSSYPGLIPNQNILCDFFVVRPFFPDDALLSNKSRMSADFSLSNWAILLPFSETSWKELEQSFNVNLPTIFSITFCFIAGILSQTKIPSILIKCQDTIFIVRETNVNRPFLEVPLPPEAFFVQHQLLLWYLKTPKKTRRIYSLIKTKKRNFTIDCYLHCNSCKVV